MVIYPRYRLYPITPDTPIDPNNQHIIFSNIPFYQVIFPLYPQLNHHGFFVGEFSPFYHVLLCGFTDEFPIQQYCQMAFSVYSHIVLEYSTYVPYFFCIVLVFKYIYINIYNIVFATFPIHSLKLSYISYIYTYSPYISHPAFLQAIHQPHLQGSTVAGHPSFVPRGYLRSEVPSLCPAAFLGREETPCAGRWSLDCRISMKMVPHQPSFMTCISIFIICSFFPRGMGLLVICYISSCFFTLVGGAHNYLRHERKVMALNNSTVKLEHPSLQGSQKDTWALWALALHAELRSSPQQRPMVAVFIHVLFMFLIV